MFKNKFFKKVTFCFLTLASVLSISIPCNAKLLEENELSEINRLTKDENFLLKKKMINDIKFCKISPRNYCCLKSLNILDLAINVNVLYMSSEIFEKMYYDCCNDCTEQYAQKITENILKQLGEKLSGLSFDVFIIKNDIKNQNLKNFIANDCTAHFIYEDQIKNKEELFTKLDF